jgi:hypothetical protein
MSGRTPEALGINEEKMFTHDAQESLALVDLETYPAFVGKKVDRLDMMAHFSDQMQALTMLSWRAPDTARRFRLLLTESDFLVERMGRSGAAQIASGNLRTYGQLCLATHEHLIDCAKNRSHDLLRGAPRAKRIAHPQLLNVPPGVYSVTLYADTTFHVPPEDAGEGAAPAIDYTVVLRHYAFPPPRVAPVRLSAGFIPWAGEEAGEMDAATSHKAPGVGVPKFSSISY